MHLREKQTLGEDDLKMNEVTNEKKQTNAKVVEKRINGIVGLRGTRRKTALATATTNLYNYLKTLNYREVTRHFLKSFFSDEVTPRTRKRVLRAIINELKKEGKIREEVVTKNITFFRNSPLCSRDYGSYSLMMEKNHRKPRHLQGVYSMSRLSIRKATQPFNMKVYVVL